VQAARKRSKTKADELAQGALLRRRQAEDKAERVRQALEEWAGKDHAMSPPMTYVTWPDLARRRAALRGVAWPHPLFSFI
jgi:hypothetical protein